MSYTLPLTSFTSNLAASLAHTEDYRAMLAEVFGLPLENVTKTGEEDDRMGFDFFLTYRDGRVRSVDVKHASMKAAQYWRSDAEPSICLEVESNVEREQPGSLFGDRVLPMFYCYVFDSLPTRVVIIPSAALRRVALSNRERWEAAYGLRSTRTKMTYGHFTSSFIAVPLFDLLQDMRVQNVITRRGPYVTNLVPA